MTYKSHSSYVLETAELTHQGGTLDFKEIFLTINLYESIEDPGMNGKIAMTDSINIPEIAPLYGDETVKLVFYTSGNESNPIEYEGIVYKISNKIRISEHTSGYYIYFCSKHVLNSTRMFVNRFFEDTISNIASSLYSEIQDQKPIVVTGTRGTYKYTFGTVDPITAIHNMIPKAISGSSDHSYVFFENNKEVKFVPIQELYKEEPVVEYGYRNAGIVKDSQTRYEEQFETIHDIEVMEENSLLDRYQDGIHGSDHFMFDFLSKKYLDDEDKFSYNKTEWYDPSKSLGRVPDKIPIEKKHDTLFLSYGYGETDVANHKDYIEDRMKLRESDMFRSLLTVMGDSKLKAGDCITVKLPNWNQNQEDVGTLFDGKFLVKKIGHILSPSSYYMSLQINKDAYEEPKI